MLATYRHSGSINVVAFSPDGGPGADWERGQYRAALGRPLGQAPGRAPAARETVTAVAFSPEGDRVLTGSSDSTARLWDARSGKPLVEPLRHEGAVSAVAFSPEGDRVLTGSSDNTARLWDGRSGNLLVEPLRHEGGVSAVAFSPEGDRVLTGSWDNTARLWDPRSGKPWASPCGTRARFRPSPSAPKGTGC